MKIAFAPLTKRKKIHRMRIGNSLMCVCWHECRCTLDVVQFSEYVLVDCVVKIVCSYHLATPPFN